MHQMANKQFQSKKNRQVKCKAIKWQETCGWVKSGWRIEKNRVCVKSQLHIETNQFNEYETENDKMSEIIEDRQSVRALSFKESFIHLHHKWMPWNVMYGKSEL